MHSTIPELTCYGFLILLQFNLQRYSTPLNRGNSKLKDHSPGRMNSGRVSKILKKRKYQPLGSWRTPNKYNRIFKSLNRPDAIRQRDASF